MKHFFLAGVVSAGLLGSHAAAQNQQMGAGGWDSLGGIADEFFTDNMRVELRSDEDVLTAFAALTPEEQQLVRDQCNGEAVTGDPDDVTTKLCAIIETR